MYMQYQYYIHVYMYVVRTCILLAGTQKRTARHPALKHLFDDWMTPVLSWQLHVQIASTDVYRLKATKALYR